ncbi:MAG: DHHA1 domain-containing protein, partial [Athalassotoga sp.]
VKVDRGTLRVGMEVNLIVDFDKRMFIARNHTATHLLQAALQKVLGDHARQAGSYVGPDRLRFDFTHNASLTDEEIGKITTLVNSEILKATPVQVKIMSLDEAKKMGAMALFGEKYGDEVRVVMVDDFSKELCGGTHVSNVGQIGGFFILSERAISSGIRRIEAITGLNTIELLSGYKSTLSEISKSLQCTQDEVDQKVKIVIEENQALRSENKNLRKKIIFEELKKEIAHATSDNKKFLVFQTRDLDPADLRDIADDAVKTFATGPVILLQENGEKVTMIVKSTNGKANDVASIVSKTFGGKGGGRSDMAQGGWNGKIEIEKIKSILSEVLK